ncbi:tRNA1(Val) (adenine(37)-N6)-methyltransferase [Candidatus Xianfuyuplasma coldseepsis]|uniref:tRNA1(Val) (Adenine(37)-N6)-methyltransferase n=1 Tax=Candidatus Xianfuyuplasma coldseepsis TaxID=2782163 RepID=A0A7L7KQY6_9MOLU|nr:tRNA1(Val) (adenine(37)-N6)-methyltransferase [Xianfuyuplasma coldseepsis]QMS85231.1 tRNA1(Val) (adenine(37)-N6)-methyltransferase [Xianfuyuplasma coldseepsis]
MDEVIHDLLGYDGIKIIQRPDMFNFSLDSTLLADFVTPLKTTKQIIDLGTGNAPVPLFLSLKTKAQIIGIEIQEEVYDLAKRSVELNNLQDQITILQKDINNIHKEFENGAFDIVTCNPPFFKYKETSNINDSDYKTIARHEVLITLEQIIKEAKRLLRTKGSLYMVHRTERFIDIIEALRAQQFSLKRVRFVYPKQGQPSNMVLIEASNNGNTALTLLEPLYVHNADGYTDEINRIFGYGKE